MQNIKIREMNDESYIFTINKDELYYLSQILLSANDNDSGVSIFYSPKSGLIRDDGTKFKARLCARFEYEGNDNECYYPVSEEYMINK